MRGLWSEKNWRLDDDALVLPNGCRIALTSIRQWRSDLIEGRFDLTGKWLQSALIIGQQRQKRCATGAAKDDGFLVRQTMLSVVSGSLCSFRGPGNCSPQRNFHFHGSKPLQMAHMKFCTGECSADEPLHRGMQLSLSP